MDDRKSATVPLDVVHATSCVGLTLTGTRQSKTVRCWVDTGGGYAFVTQQLADELGLTAGPDAPGDGDTYKTVRPSAARIGDFAIDVSPVPVAIAGPNQFDRTNAEAFLPAKVLAQYHVVFDYPGRRFAIGDLATAPAGTQIDMAVSSNPKFPRVELTIDGQAHGMLLDTGASHTMISQTVFDQWHRAHPDWPVTKAALGTANMGHPGADRGRQMMRIPQSQLGGVMIRDMSVVTRPPGTFENFMSPLMSSPIDGALAGNVLEQLRIELDYAAEKAYVLPADVQLPPRFVAPFSVDASEGFRILDVLDAARTALRPGDDIVSVDGGDISADSFGSLIASLTSDTPGKRTVVVRREGAAMTAVINLVAV